MNLLKNNKKIFLLTSFIALVFSCTTRSDKSNSISEDFEKDSIYSKIENGRNIELTIKERKKILERAYKLVDLVDNDSLRTKYFSRLSLAYLRLNDSLLFRETNKKTIKLATTLNDSIVHAEAHWDLAEFLRSITTLDSSYYNFAQAHKIYTSLNYNYESGVMLYNMAAVQADVKDYTGSEITTIKAIKLLNPLNQYEQLYRCYNNLGIVTNNLKEYDKAIEYHEKAQFYLEKLKRSNNLLISTLNNIGVVYQKKQNHKKAIPYFQEVLSQDSLIITNTKLYAKALNNIALSKLKLGDTKELPKLFLNAIRIQDSIEDYSGISRSYYSLSEYYAQQKDTVNALLSAVKAKKSSKRSSNYNRLLLTFNLLTRLDPKNASLHAQNYINLNDSLNQADRRIRNKFTRIEFETDEVKEKNALLAKQQQLWIGISIGLFILALFIVLAIYQRIRNQKLRFEQQQQASNQEIFDLMLNQKEQIQEGKQAEQKRISEELHDGIVGQMAGIRLMFIGLNKRKDEDSVERREGLIKKLQETEEEIRTISHELNHASYQKIHNFINSIQELLDSTGSVAEIENNFYYNQETDWDDLSSEIKINLYRIVQESLQNCVKYAKASNILLDFDTNENMIKIVISDNGVGFDTKKGKKGIGLKNIQSRVKKLNGTWEISSTIGEGTTTIIEIPRSMDEMISDYPLKKVL